MSDDAAEGYAKDVHSKNVDGLEAKASAEKIKERILTDMLYEIDPLNAMLRDRYGMVDTLEDSEYGMKSGWAFMRAPLRCVSATTIPTEAKSIDK